MKHTRTLLTALLLAPLAALRAADAPEKAKPAAPPEFASITDDPKLSHMLLMGDSVSIAYALDVRKLLAGVANVHRLPANCGSTKTALGSYGLVRWLPDANEKWDVVHFNYGLHDLSYRFADGSDPATTHADCVSWPATIWADVRLPALFSDQLHPRHPTPTPN